MLGKPVIKGTRITVEHILKSLSEGASFDNMVEMYPHLSIEDIRAALAYAYHALSHEETVSV